MEVKKIAIKNRHNKNAGLIIGLTIGTVLLLAALIVFADRVQIGIVNY